MWINIAEARAHGCLHLSFSWIPENICGCWFILVGFSEEGWYSSLQRNFVKLCVFRCEEFESSLRNHMKYWSVPQWYALAISTLVLA